MERFLPYQALMQTQGLSKKDLPSEIQTLIKKIESTVRSVALVGKKDEQGDYIVTANTQKKIKELDSKIVNLTWDWIEDKQRNEIRKSVPNAEPKSEEPKSEETVNQDAPKEESLKGDSKGKIGFFDW
jgi:hypothetical protein